MIALTILAALGSTIIITRSWIFESIREYFNRWQFTGILFHCPTCMGFWNGLFYSIIFGLNWKIILGISLTTSLFGYIINMVEDAISHYIYGN